ncbi:hypothetical protein GCK72_017372 [Caenorhabditis remanei]|uniref:Uncharacterized protein n=1 Tax=Caenorhabditis remanei TaxID=31234 RepID=A0A6A5G7W3_CAERE|nr:hypothetical protein GCK72_017372 [Caenorhabditis remanei]KAF1750821.1 hypothetical protein GCK72_017372 [Caenorhabditis remanei]
MDDDTSVEGDASCKVVNNYVMDIAGTSQRIISDVSIASGFQKTIADIWRSSGDGVIMESDGEDCFVVDNNTIAASRAFVWCGVN